MSSAHSNIPIFSSNWLTTGGGRPRRAPTGGGSLHNETRDGLPCAYHTGGGRP